MQEGTVVVNPGAQTFLDQLDTPSSYSGEAGKAPLVNSGGTALEFVLVSGADPTKTYKDPVLSRSLLSPPPAPSDGDRYIIGTGVSGDWYSAGGTWTYRQKITIDKDKVPSDQSNFPVPVIITDAGNTLFGHANSSGFDILFTSDDKLTKLDHELIEYDGTVGSKNLEAYVRIPTLSSTGDTDIYMYYGNAAVAADPSLAATWDAGYKFVQHLSDLTASTTKDSVNASSNMTKGATAQPTEVDGKIGKAQSCDGINDYLKTANNFLSAPAKITVSAWIKKEAGGHTYECALHKGTGNTIGSSDYWLGVDISDYLCITIGANQGGVGWDAGKTTTKAVYGTWYHLSAVWDGSVVKVYLNGVFNKQYNLGSYGNNNTDTRIGASADGTNYQFKGLVDEVRLSDSERSADWITTEYNAQNSPSTFMSFDTEESPAAGGDWAPYPKYITYYSTATTGWIFDGPPAEGWTAWVEDEDARVDYVGTAWKSGDLLVNHNQTAGLQGGTTGEKYHMTEVEHTAAIRLATDALSGLMPPNKLNSWDSAWHIGTVITQEIQLEMEAPSFRLHDTLATGDGTHAIRGVYDTSTGTSYPGFALYKGTVTEDAFTADPANPLLHLDTGNQLNLYDNLGIRGNKELRFYNGTFYVGFEASTGTTGNQIYKLPDADGLTGDVLQTNGSGTLSWLTGATTDEKVKVTSTGTADYIGLTSTGGIIRVDGTMTKTGTANYVTLGVNATGLDHDSLLNTHNLTTDIDHDSITNTHNLTTDIDHDTITNAHNLTTDIDHDSITNTHDLTSDINHNTITNAHNLTTDIDHDAITNTHNLTSDITHNSVGGLTTGDPHTQYVPITGTRGFTVGSDAVGDMYYRSTGGGMVRLGVGTSGQTITISTGGLPAYTAPSAGVDVKVALSTGGTADYLGETSTGGILRTDETITKTASTGTDYVTLAVDQTKLRVTHCVTYYLGLASAVDNILGVRTWQDETVTSFDNEPDVPRNLQVDAANLDFLNAMAGTVTVNGLDADGATIAEVFTVSVAAAGSTTYTGNKAFATLTSIVVDKTGASTNPIYSVGYGEKMGLPNYPFNAAGDVFKMTRNKVDETGYTVSTTYGTVTPATGIIGNDFFTFWYRPYAT